MGLPFTLPAGISGPSKPAKANCAAYREVSSSATMISIHAIYLSNETRLAQPRHGAWYELAAILDRKVAGLLPFSYEFGLKDIVFGTFSLHFG